MDKIEIANARLTLVAGQSFFAHLWRSGPGPEPTLWRSTYYRSVFNQLRGGQSGLGFEFAWRPTQRSAFWCHYLGDQPLGTVSADSAWANRVPLRLSAEKRPQLETDDPQERVFYDCYGYPFGIVAAITIQCAPKTAETLAQWRARLRRLRLAQPFTLHRPEGTSLAKAKAATILEELLGWHRRAFYGEVKEVFQSTDPISINTVIQASGISPAVPVTKDLQRTLHAVTHWPQDWENAVLPDLAAGKVALPVKAVNDSPGDIFYASGRGRTLWRPGLFSLKAETGQNRPHTLSCLHHNLVAGSVQSEALRLFAIGYAGSPTAQNRLDDEIVDQAAGLITALHSGAGSYRSASLQRLLEDPNSKSEVNSLLEATHRPALG